MKKVDRRGFMKTVGGTVIAPSPFNASSSPVVVDSDSRSALGTGAPGNDQPALRVALRVRVDIRENLYDRWAVISNSYGLRGEDDFALGFRPACPSNQTTYYGQAFGSQPAAGNFPGQARVTGFQGQRLVNTKNRNLGTMIGELQSDPFQIKGDEIDFLIGGGDFKEQTCINLFVETKSYAFEKVRTATGDRNLRLVRKQWDVSAWKGKWAYLQIVDYAPVEKWGDYAAVSFPEDDYGFILLDDIRQTDGEGKRVSEAYDRENNFDFESVRTPQHRTEPGDAVVLIAHGQRMLQQFAVTERGSHKGTFSLNLSISEIAEHVYRCDQHWTYTGKTLSGVKLETLIRTPITLNQCQFFLHPGILYNGNVTAEKCHYLGEDFPEDTSTLPGGFSVEDEHWVVGGWIEPQTTGSEPKSSVRLQKNYDADCFEAVYLVPDSAQFGRRMFLDADTRLTVDDGFALRKSLYLYLGPKKTFNYVPNKGQGYGQVIKAGWATLYPQSATNPPHSLGDDYQLRLRTLLDSRALMQEITLGSRNYRVFFVGRWIVGDHFNFTEDYTPKRYFHNYVGFSWSGMAGLACYAAFQEYVRTASDAARRVAEDTMDLFVDHGISPLGILYPVYFEKDGLYGGADPGSLGGGFGTYGQLGNIDLCPLGEGLYWYVKCYRLLKEKGIADKGSWIEAVRTSLDKIMQLYPDGDIPGRINGTTGNPGIKNIDLLYWAASKYTHPWSRPARVVYPKPSEGGPTTFAYLVWALVAFYQLSGQAKYLEYAKTVGDKILLILERYGTFSGSEMDFFNIDKRGSHAAFAAVNYLYEASGEPKWLDGARLCANSFSTWQYSYNVNFDCYRDLPLGRFDYRTIGGTPVDIKVSTNNLVFNQGAEEFLKLWNATGEEQWFERARALLHQGTESTLTEPKRQWLNDNYQGPAEGFIRSLNPSTGFDSHCLGGGTEDVLPAWPFKGNWTTKSEGILSMYMLAEAMPVEEILRKYGSICYSFKWRYGGALDTLDNVKVLQESDGVQIEARNMIAGNQTYRLKLLDYPGQSVILNDEVYDHSQIAVGIPVRFSSRQTKRIRIRKA